MKICTLFWRYIPIGQWTTTVCFLNTDMTIAFNKSSLSVIQTSCISLPLSLVFLFVQNATFCFLSMVSYVINAKEIVSQNCWRLRFYGRRGVCFTSVLQWKFVLCCYWFPRESTRYWQSSVYARHYPHCQSVSSRFFVSAETMDEATRQKPYPL